MVESVSDTLAKIARDHSHGSAELWLLLYVTSRGGKARWTEAIRDYAEAKGWSVESARVKLERAYLKLKRLDILHKRREKKLVSGPREVYVALTPRSRAIILHLCD